jgi:hypothetical protein
MNSFLRRIEAIEMRSTGCPMISASEASDIKSQLRSKLGLPAKLDDIVMAPISRKSLEAARESAQRKLRCYLELHEPKGEQI